MYSKNIDRVIKQKDSSPDELPDECSFLMKIILFIFGLNYQKGNFADNSTIFAPANDGSHEGMQYGQGMN